jgi:hypothetical protein
MWPAVMERLPTPGLGGGRPKLHSRPEFKFPPRYHQVWTASGAHQASYLNVYHGPLPSEIVWTKHEAYHSTLTCLLAWRLNTGTRIAFTQRILRPRVILCNNLRTYS